MADFVTIFMLSIAMFFGCGLAGWIPMAFSLSQRSVQLLTIFGAGLLVGTALVVIIPEGVDTMYNHPKQASEVMQVKEMSLVENANNIIISSPEVGDDDQAKAEAIKDHHDDDDGPHHAVGISLLLGFVFMLLVDQIGGKSHAHVHAPEIRLDELNQSKVGTSRSLTPDAKSKGHTATIGLVVHAAADGIALGAAASTDRHDLQLIVFLAIMLHKAPAAFGLTSFLIHEGLEPRRVKKHLLAFALAAPLLAILTFLFLNQNDRQWLVEANATGIAMLFSAGTFLYVATVHVLPEVASSHGGAGGKNQLSLFEVFVLVAGTLCPLLLNLGHSHGHHG